MQAGERTPSHIRVFALILISYVTARKVWQNYSQELKSLWKPGTSRLHMARQRGMGLIPASAGRPCTEAHQTETSRKQSSESQY